MLQGQHIPKPSAFKVNGSKSKVPDIDPAHEVKDNFDNGLEPPVELETKEERKLWDTVIRKAPWLTEYDIYAAHSWVVLQVRFMRNPDMFRGSMISQLRAMRNELGLDPASRTRMKVPTGAKTKAQKFFGKPDSSE